MDIINVCVPSGLLEKAVEVASQMEGVLQIENDPNNAFECKDLEVTEAFCRAVFL